MTRIRSVLLGVAVVLLVALLILKPGERPALATGPATPSLATEYALVRDALWRQARSDDPEQREEARLRLVGRLSLGMPRRQVLALLGPPDMRLDKPPDNLSRRYDLGVYETPWGPAHREADADVYYIPFCGDLTGGLGGVLGGRVRQHPRRPTACRPALLALLRRGGHRHPQPLALAYAPGAGLPGRQVG